MTPPQLIGYGALALVALYLAYLVSLSLLGLLWSLLKILLLGSLLAVIIWFLHKKGFFAAFNK